MIEIKNRYTGEVIKTVDSGSLIDANLENADLENADLKNANLRYADLRGADLENADLENADLRYANLENADLRYADLENANLRYANLIGADLKDADVEKPTEQKLTFPRMMLVRNEISENWEVKEIHAIIKTLKYPYISVDNNDEYLYHGFYYCKEIEEVKQISKADAQKIVEEKLGYMAKITD